MLIIFVLIALIPLAIVGLVSFRGIVSDYNINKVLDEIEMNANEVAELGGSRIIHVEIPENVVVIRFFKKTILFKIKKGNDVVDLIRRTKSQVNGTLPTESGLYRIKIYLYNQSLIQINKQ